MPIAIIGIVIIICTACGKEEEEQKLMASVLAGECLNDNWKKEMQIFNARLAEEWEALKESPDNLTEDELDEEFLGKLEKSYRHSNVYFYNAEETVHTYEGYFYLHTYTDIWQDVDLHITNNDTVWNYVNDFLSGRISRKQFWALAEFRYPTHQISFHTLSALDCITFDRSEIVYDRKRKK